MTDGGDGPPRAVLARFANARPGLSDLPARRPGHAAVATVWMLGDAFVLRARGGGPGAEADLARESGLVRRVRPLLPWAMPDPLPADDGRTFVSEGDALWTLHRAIPGRVLWPWQRLHEASEPDRRRLVDLMVRLHHATEGRLEPGADDWLLREAGRSFRSAKELLSPTARREVERGLGALERGEGRCEPARCAFVHGDFHWGNVLVGDDGEVTGLVDLDGCRVGDPLDDLGYTAMMLARDCDTGTIDPAALDEAARWYGVPSARRPRFDAACLLYAVFDVDLFRRARSVPDRERLVSMQVAVVEALAGLG